MTDIPKKNTIEEAAVIISAITARKPLQYRFLTGKGVWKNRANTQTLQLPDFLNFEYRLTPGAAWIVVYTSMGDGQHSWIATDLDRAISLATQANQLGRKLQYVIKVEGDVATIQKTPQ